MKRTVKLLLVTVLALMLISASAAAAGPEAAAEPQIGMQLNGEATVLKSGVAPYYDAKAYRNYVPFRDLLEALGAEVDYDEATQVVSAVRGDTAISFFQYGQEIQITQNGATRVLKTDVAPITREGRTLVPVRFVSEALGCQVGWDDENKTVVIVDPATLIAGRGKTYELVNALQTLGTLPAGKSYATTGDMTMKMSITEAGKTMAIPVAVKLNLLQNDQAADGTMVMDMDMSQLGAVEPTLAMVQNLRMNIEVIMSLEKGLLWVHSAELNTMMDLDAAAWLALDLNQMMGAAGAGGLSLDMGGLSGLSLDTAVMKVEDLMAMGLASVDLDSVEAYTEMNEMLTLIENLLADQSFKKDGNTYTNTFELTEDGANVAFKLAITTDGAGKVTGYTIKLNLKAEGVSLALDAQLTAKGGKVKMSMEAEGVLALELEADMAMAESDKTPRARLPEGAVAIDYLSALTAGL